MEPVVADIETFHLGLGDLDAFLIDPRVEGALNFESGLGACRRDELVDGSVVCERRAAPVVRDAAVEAVLDLVPFRCARRIVPDLDREAGLVGELLQLHFPHVSRSSRRNLP